MIPRMMKRTTAAAYCDLSIATFEREINAGRLPSPVILGNREHWCRNALDRALDQLTAACCKNVLDMGGGIIYRFVHGD